MRADFRVANAARRIEGPLLFLERSVNVGLNEALYVIGRDGRVIARHMGFKVKEQDEYEAIIIEALRKPGNDNE